MSCRIENGKAILPNGKQSKLYDKLKENLGHKADNIYETVYGEEFRKFWGSDFQKDVGQSQIDDKLFKNVDENGEPILYSDVGFYEFMNPKGETFQVAEAFREESKLLDLGGRSDQETVELQEDFVNTAVYLINTLKTKANLSEREVSEMFDNNVLRNEILKLTFKNKDITNETVQELYGLLQQTNGYDKFEKKRKELGIELTSNWDVFVWAYEQYNAQVDSLGNETSIGARDLIKNALSRYNQRLKDGDLIQELIDDEFVKIFSQSRIEDNPKDKLSGKAKAIISSIVMGTNSLGYPRTLTTDIVYAIIAEATVGRPNFKSMINRLDHVAKYKPEAQAILDRLRAIPANQQATIFSTFKNTYKNFIFFKQEREEDGSYTNRIINSNLSDVRMAARREYTQNSEEHIQENPRAIYKIEKGEQTVKPEKLRRAQNAWEIVNNARGEAVWSDEQIDALGTYLWELGMNYGPTLETTQNYLKLYHAIGDETGAVGGIALTRFAFSPKLRFGDLIKFVEDNPTENIHRKKGSIIDKIANLNLLFSEQPFGSFISGALKQMYPVNTPTSLDELSELINDEEQSPERTKYLESLNNTALFNPTIGIKDSITTKYKSILLRSFNKIGVRKRFKNRSLDSYKSLSRNEAVDYGALSPRNSLIIRMLGYENKGDETFSHVAVPVQADRNNFSMQEMPRVNALNNVGITINEREIIEGLIVQDLARMNAAKKLLIEAQETGNTSKLIKGYHYRNTPFDRQGSVFTMPQIFGNENTKINEVQDASDLLESFLDGTNPTPFQKILNEKVNLVQQQLLKYEEETLKLLDTYNIKLVKEVNKKYNTPTKVKAFVKEFIFNDFVMRIELNKFTRAGFLGKNTSDYYKRSGLLNTPGTKLAIQGDLKDPSYGMMPTYKTLVIKDFQYTDREGAQSVVENLKRNGLDEETANLYGPANVKFAKTDAQTFISVDMYRGIMQGMGEWTKEDEDAYDVYRKGGGYNRPVKPLKPYHEQTDVKNGISYMHMDKNSYTVITPELVLGFPYYEVMLDAMRNGIHAVHTESATKGMSAEPQDFQNTLTLDTSNPMVMNSRKLRFPQMIPTGKTIEDGLTFNRQLRKNIITNIQKNENYNIGGNTMKGFEVQNLFYESIADNIKEDTARVLKDLGISKLNSIENKATLEHKKAKLEHLKKLRDAIRKEIEQRDLPQNYLDGLDIVPNGLWDYMFRIPLSFPHYSSRYETIISGILNKEIYQQKLRGTDVVQIAELGGHDVTGELKMYDGQNGGAEVRIKASLLGFTAKEIEGKTVADFAGDPRLEFIGFRIPQQGKNSAMVFRTVQFLPESYDKAIMVPGGIVVQQGSDFDIDKLNLIFKEPGKTKRAERNNTIYDIFKGILLDKKHLEEVMKPVDNVDLAAYQVKRADADYNNPNYEIEMERIQTIGIAGRGLWSNMIAGRNVAQTLGVLSISAAYAPVIDGQVYNTVATKDLDGNFTDANISQYLSAAVDAAKDPIQIDINDNKYTIPVAGLMLTVGIPIQTVVAFLQHPAILKEIKTAQDKNLREDFLLRRFSYVEIADRNRNLSTSSILDQSIDDAQALTNFKAFHIAGKQLQRVNKIITPDNLDNVNEISSILSQIEEENYYLYNEESVIEKAGEYIMHQKETNKPLHASNVAYRGIFDTILNTTRDLGFLQNSPSFISAKSRLKRELFIDVLTPQQHKFIDRALFRFIMTMPHSPLRDLTSRETIYQLYSPDSETNLVKRTQELGLKYPRLLSNRFFRLLKVDSSNKETNLSNIQLDTSTDLSTADKNALSNGLLAMITDSEQEIKDFGKALVSNQLITTGFNPTYGSYIDLIPSEVLTTDILNPGKGSPVEFFRQELDQLQFDNYTGFNNFTHEFVRNFGLSRPGGRDLVSYVKLSKKDQTMLVSESKSVDITDDQVGGKYPMYLKTTLLNNQEVLLVANFLGGRGSYRVLSRLGAENKIYEINTGERSIFSRNRQSYTTEALPYQQFTLQENTDIDRDNNTEIQPEKVCKT